MILIAGVTVIACLAFLASCGETGTEPKTSVKPDQSSEETPVSTEAKTNAPETTETPATQEPAQTIEVGTTVKYKMALYLDEAQLSEGEKFVQNVSNGFIRIDDEFMINEDDTYQLFWTSTEEGETMTIPMNITQSGTYKLTITQFNGGDFGIFQYFIGETLLGEIDCFNTNGGLYNFDLGSVELDAGDFSFIVRRTGKNENSAGSVFAINELNFECTAVK